MNLRHFYYSVKYTKPEQLYYRLKYSLRRKFRYVFRNHFREKLNLTYFFKLTDNLPLPVFPVKNGIIRKDENGYAFTLLNKTRSFPASVNWFPGESDLWNLQLHYMEYLEEVDDNEFQILITDWIDNNPPYMKNYGITNWSSYSLSIRTLVWMQQFALRHEKLNKEFKIKFLSSLISQIQFLSENLELDIVGNHLIKNIKTLLWAGSFFKSPESDKWKKRGEDLLSTQLDEQILPDGMHFELSTAYHLQVFADLVECYTVLQNKTLGNKLRVLLNKMAQVIANISFPDNSITLFNDGSLDMSYSPAACLQVWKKISGNKFTAEKIFSLKDSGYYGIHQKNYDIVIDAGRVAPDYLPAHSHGDIFSFELSCNSKRFIVDPGVFEYAAGKRRSYSRATKSHNTINLDGLDQCEFYGSFRLARRASVTIDNFTENNEGFTLSAYHDGYKRLPGKPIHRRIFEVSASGIKISDQIMNGKGQRAEARLLLHPECKYEIIDKQVIISRGIDFIILECDAEIYTEQAYWFPDFGMEEITTQIVLNYGKIPVSSFFKIMLPGKTDESLISKEFINNFDTIERAK